MITKILTLLVVIVLLFISRKIKQETISFLSIQLSNERTPLLVSETFALTAIEDKLNLIIATEKPFTFNFLIIKAKT